MIDPAKKSEIYGFLKRHRFGVVSTVARDGAPEAALVGLAAMPDLILIFETLNTTRKYANLQRDPHVALVIGWDGERTLQYEGLADEPDSPDWDSLKDSYYAALPENRGHEGWPGLTYIRVRPIWMRLSNYGASWNVEEYRFDS